MTNFNDVPQEKFDKMNKDMQKSVKKDIKNLKVNYIDIQNFKNIDYITTELGDWNIVGGYNGNGKSSFIEAILTAIKGQKFFGGGAISPSSLVKSGENKAVINMQIKGNNLEIILERIFKKGTAKNPAGKTELVATLNGEKISQASLDELLNALTLDPLKLGTLSITEQIKEIKATTGLDTDEIDKQIKDKEESRKESRGYKNQAVSIYDELIASGIPEKIKEVSLSGLFEDRKILDKNKKNLEEYKKLKAQIEEMAEKLEGMKVEGQKLEEVIAERKLGTLVEMDQKIVDIEETNKNANKYDRFISAKNKKDSACNDFKKEEELLEELRSDRTKIIADSNLPEYMEISDDYGILVDGVEYKLLNTAKKIEVAIDLILISGSPLRMIRIEQGGELDTKTLESIKPKIIKNNFCIFIERPIIDKYDTIIINDGELLDGEEMNNFIKDQ